MLDISVYCIFGSCRVSDSVLAYVGLMLSVFVSNSAVNNYRSIDKKAGWAGRNSHLWLSPGHFRVI